MWVSGEARGSQAETEPGERAHLLLRVWQGLKGERSAPGRSDLDLRQLPRLVPWLFIAEPEVGSTGYHWRLAGTGIVQFLGCEVTGGDFLSGWERFERGVITKALGAVTGQHQSALFRMRYLSDRGDLLDAEMLALPMLARDGATTHVLGGLFPQMEAKIRHYARVAPAELSVARVLGHADVASPASQAQARRKFHVISGGLDEG